MRDSSSPTTCCSSVIDLGNGVAPRASREVNGETGGLDVDVRAERRGAQERAGSIGRRALHLHLHRRPGQEFGDRTLPYHLAVVNDGDRVAGPLDFIEKMRRENHRASLGDQGLNHVTHVVHTRGVQPVHRLIQDQELRVAK